MTNHKSAHNMSQHPTFLSRVFAVDGDADTEMSALSQPPREPTLLESDAGTSSDEDDHSFEEPRYTQQSSDEEQPQQSIFNNPKRTPPVVAPKNPGFQEEPHTFLSRKKPVWDEEAQKPTGRVITGTARVNRMATISSKERALWKWANVENLDAFLQEVYRYFLGNGFTCIILDKALNMCTLLFVVYFSTYLGYCIDYSKLRTSTTLQEVKVAKCYSTIGGGTKFVLWCFYIFAFLKAIQLYSDIKKLSEIRNFYEFLLEIADSELQTVSWQTVVQRIVNLKDQNAITANVSEVKAKSRIDAHDIANRIMRKDNYLIALYNKNILDLSLPIPLFRTSVLTKTLEWNLNLCIIGFAFNEHGFLKQGLLKESQRKQMAEDLKKRFMLAALFNVVLSPFLVAYFVLLYFFRYFNEYKTTPGAVGSRQYSPITEWKFREYNELYHIFHKRLSLSVPVATKYVNQFPNGMVVSLMKFFGFVAGSFAAILGILSIFDPENFFNFEITKDRTALFYLTVFGAIWAVCKSSIPEEYQIFDPESTLEELSSYTHYTPKEWEGRMHTEDVKKEFCKLFNLRVILLLRELVSLVMTPFILWFSLPKSTERIVDFFREFSVHVDGLGYVCTYAMFNFAQNKKKRANDIRGEYFNDGTDKMIKSYMYFMESYNNTEDVGKNQLPAKNSSWKQPFLMKPNKAAAAVAEMGGSDLLRPREFKPSMKGGESHRNSEEPNQQTPTFEHPIKEPGTSTIVPMEESFIHAMPKPSYETDPKDTGVLGLLNQYYRKNDVGR